MTYLSNLGKTGCTVPLKIHLWPLIFPYDFPGVGPLYSNSWESLCLGICSYSTFAASLLFARDFSRHRWHKGVLRELTINVTSGHQIERGRKGPMLMFISWILHLLPISSTLANSLYQFSGSANVEFQIVDLWLVYKQSSALHFSSPVMQPAPEWLPLPTANINQFYHSGKHQETGSPLKVGTVVILFCVRHPSQHPVGAP